MIWLGGAVSPQILDDLWGVDSLEELDVRMVSFCLNCNGLMEIRADRRRPAYRNFPPCYQRRSGTSWRTLNALWVTLYLCSSSGKIWMGWRLSLRITWSRTAIMTR